MHEDDGSRECQLKMRIHVGQSLVAEGRKIDWSILEIFVGKPTRQVMKKLKTNTNYSYLYVQDFWPLDV